VTQLGIFYINLDEKSDIISSSLDIAYLFSAKKKKVTFIWYKYRTYIQFATATQNISGKMTNNGINRTIYLWSHPRSVSTAFFRCISESKNFEYNNCKLEPFIKKYNQSGEEIDIDTRLEEFVSLKRDMDSADNMCFVNEHAWVYADFLNGNNIENVLPKHCTHTFIVREPVHSFISLQEICDKSEMKVRKKEASYCGLEIFLNYATHTLGQKIIIVNADDLNEDPEKVVKKYCHEAEITFDESMMKWDPIPILPEEGEASDDQYAVYCAQFRLDASWHKGVMASTRFEKKTVGSYEIKNVDEEFKEMIYKNRKIFQKLTNLPN
jgi:hypothetical protein